MVVRRIDEPLADAQAWAEWFNAQITDLPLLRQTHRRIDELTRHAAEINLHELASVVLADPLLTLRTLVTVHQRKRAASRDLTGITSALMMIGIAPFTRQIGEMSTVETILADERNALTWLLSRVARARKAAHFAHDWSTLRRDIEGEEVTVAATLLEINEILLWLYAPKLMALLVALRKRFPSHPIEVLQRKVFNTTDSELREALINRLQLPTILKDLMDPTKNDNPRVRTVLLATRLARHVTHGWNHPQLPQDIEAIEAHLHINRETLLRRLEVPYELWPTLGVPVPPTAAANVTTS